MMRIMFNLFHQYLLDSGIGDASWVVATHDTTHDVEQEATQEDKLVVFCDEERFRQEMMDF